VAQPPLGACPSRTLALDLATATGYAFDGPHAGVPVTGLYRVPRSGGTKKDGLEFGPGFAAFRAWLVAMIGQVKPDILAFEAPLQIVHTKHGSGGGAGTSQSTIRFLFGLASITEEVGAALSVETFEQNNSSIKRHFTGSGAADKAAMLRMCATLRWDVGGDHNRADAAALWSRIKSMRDPRFAPMSTPLFAVGGKPR
jgi:hypothetical protein